MEDFFEELNNRPKPNIFKKIKLWWNFDGKYYHIYFIQGIKNIIYWFPIIWKDRNYDQKYIFDILKHKLKSQSKYIFDRDKLIRSKLNSKRMMLCVSLIDKIQDEFYEMEFMDYHKDRVWFTTCKDNPELLEYNSEEVCENYDDLFKKYKLIYRKVLNGEGPYKLDDVDNSDMKKIIAMNICHINQKRAQDLLFRILNENINLWWD